jgi:hypothetical protein
MNKNDGIDGHASGASGPDNNRVQIETRHALGRITDEHTNGCGGLTERGNVHRRIPPNSVEKGSHSQSPQCTLDPFDRKRREDHGKVWHHLDIAPTITHE